MSKSRYFAAALASLDAARAADPDNSDAGLDAYYAARGAALAHPDAAARADLAARADALHIAYLEARDSLEAALEVARAADPGNTKTKTRFRVGGTFSLTGPDPFASDAAAATATFEQAFAELAKALECSPHRLAASEETTKIERLDAVTFALDKLPALNSDRVTDLLQKSAALAALAAAAATELQAAAESHEVAFQPDLDLSLAVTAREELRDALECLDRLPTFPQPETAATRTRGEPKR